MESNLQAGIKMKQNLQLTALSAALALTGCGGGGGGGFYGPNSSANGTSVVAPVATNYHITLSSSKPTIVVTGDTAVVTARLLDVNGGGVADQEVILSIPNTLSNGVTLSGPAKVKTDANGNATFTITLPAGTSNAAGLIKDGIAINATFTDATNKVTSQTTTIGVVSSQPASASQYQLAVSSSKASLIVTGDTAAVTVKALDTNGGGVAGQNVVLSLPAAMIAKGVTIDGSSKATTDANGNAIFNITLAPATGSNATALITSGIDVNASITDASNVTIKQTTHLAVQAAAVVAANQYHLVMNTSKSTIIAGNDTATVTIKALDTNGGGVAGKTVVLNIPSAATNGVTINGASTATTDASGNASFTVQSQTNNNTVNLAALIASGVVLNATLTDPVTNTTTTQSTLLNAVSTLTPAPTIPLYHLAMAVSKPSIVITGDTAVVTVKALDVNGGAVGSQNVTLQIPDTLTNGVTISGSSTVKTDATGNAVFTVVLPTATPSKPNPASLLTSGVTFTATVTDANNLSSSQSTLVNVIAAPVQVAAQYHLVMNSSKTSVLAGGDTVSVTTKLVDANGGGVAGQNVLLNIPSSANNGVTINGSSSGITDVNGNATFNLVLNSAGLTATQKTALLNGIDVNSTFTDTNNVVVTQVKHIDVSKNALTAALYKLTTRTSKDLLVTGDTATVVVTADKVDGSGRVGGKEVTLSIPNAAALGVTLTSPATVLTDVNGNAIFTIALAAGTTANTSQLLSDGVLLQSSITDNNGVTSNDSIKENVVTAAPIALPIYHVAVLSSTPTISLANGSTTATITSQLLDANGNGVAAQNVVLSLPLAVMSSGVTISGSPSGVTDVNGYATFTINVPAGVSNAQALIASGIDASVSYTDAGNNKIKQSTNINVVQTTPNNYHLAMSTSTSVILVTGGTATVTVKALDINAGGVAGQTVTLRIPDSTTNGMTINGSSTAVTDAQGNAVFSVTLPDDTSKAAAIIASGVDLEATLAGSTNVAQTTHINVIQPPVPSSANYRIDLTPSAPTVLVSAGTAVVTTKLVDANGGGVAGQSVVLSIPDSATSGVTINGSSTAVTDANGNVTYTLNLPTTGASATALIANGVVVNATYTATNGAPITQTTKINVAQTLASVSLYHLAVVSSKSTILVTGDTATVTVKTLDARNGGVAGKNVVLSIPAASGMTINGSSTAVSDVNGNAVFTVNLADAGANAAALVASGIDVTATVTDANNVSFSMPTHFNVVQPPAAASASYQVILASTKDTLVVTGDTATLTAKLVDANGAGVANQSVVLSVPAAAALGGVTIVNPTGNVTDASGNITFTVKLTAAGSGNSVSQAAQTALLAAGNVAVNAVFTATDGTVKQQQTLINVVKAATALQYHLTLQSNKTSIVATANGDTAQVTMMVLDANGGGVANQKVELSIDDTVNLGVVITGGPSNALTSSVTTDEYGTATFNVTLRPFNATTSPQPNLAALLANGITVNASVLQNTGVTTKQITHINAVPSPVPLPVGQITISQSNKITSSADNVFYSIPMSINVVGLDGKPIANQVVTMKVNQLQYFKGGSAFPTDAQITAGAVAQWYTVPTKTCTPTAPVNTPYSPITFVNPVTSSGSTVTYVTDATGKADFSVRYGKNYANWLDASFVASTTVLGQTVQSLPSNTGLPASVADISDKAVSPPNGSSPYNAIPNATDAGICN